MNIKEERAWAGSQSSMLQLGALNTAWAASIAYYFGTTFGSGSKTELIARAPAITN